MKLSSIYQLLILAVSLSMWTSGAEAKTQAFSSTTFKDAKHAESSIRFDMSSTKLGIVTTSFEGVAKQFTVTGEVQESKLAEGAQLEFPIAALDTDNSSRNEKMWNHCLDYKNNPVIKMVLKKDLQLNGDKHIIPATIFIRGAEKPLILTAKGHVTSKGLEVDVFGDLSIKDLEIPDPSILIATVKDNIKVTAHFVITQF